ncbi:hypothetical protein ONV78_08615 [Hahella sp. CR1]|uniref:hypothetical protein n=1 Tax=Hahella sp. CR1 TaxID=2992807 RepID=UPI002443364D|nr:hypothetical protein [Hahella sp. CR1]MDG9667791.1 hypothetical protein [Hahella sp. CR1]
MFTDEHITRLLNQQPISDAPPWCDGDERAVDSFYKYVCARVSQLTMAQFHAEWKHYGSGYASFVDVCFYQGKAAQGQDAPEQMGLEVLFSRLSPYFVLMEAPVPTSGFHSLPSFNGLDRLRTPNVIQLAQTIQPILEDFGLLRLYKSDLNKTLPRQIKVPAVLNEGACKLYDALFYWED